MPRSCSVCHSPDAAAINKELARGASKQTVSDRYPKLSPSSIQRHRQSCLLIQSRDIEPRKRSSANENTAPQNEASTPDAVDRFDTKAEIATPSDLLKRLRTLFRLGDLLERAYRRRDVDDCVKLARELRSATESYAKIAGWLSEGVQVNVDARKQSMTLLAKFSDEELRSGIAALIADASEGAAEPVIDAEVVAIEG